MNAADSGAQTVDGARAENPWPGLRPYDEAEKEFFYGRSRETEELLALVKRATLTVLFGISGIGKSSLLSAGLFPRLRGQGFFPLRIRIDFADPNLDLALSVRSLIGRESAKWKVQEDVLAPPYASARSETLWEYFHRTSFWGESGAVTPVLVVDQFEEIFTRGADPRVTATRDTVLRELSDLIENHIPQLVRAQMETTGRAPTFVDDEPDYRVVLCLREDYLPFLEELVPDIPSLSTRNRFRLTAMSTEQAMEVVCKPGGKLVTEAVARQIVTSIADVSRRGLAIPADLHRGRNGHGEVEPFLLSIVCYELNKKRFGRRPPVISADLVSQFEAKILRDFYQDSFAGLAPEVQEFVEDQLVSGGGYREMPATKDLPAAVRAAVDTLVDRRVVRKEEDRHGVERIELIHDRLAEIALVRRKQRREREEIQQWRRRAFLSGALALFFLVLAMGVGYLAYRAVRAEHETATTLALLELRVGRSAIDRDAAAEALAHLARGLRPRESAALRCIFDWFGEDPTRAAIRSFALSTIANRVPPLLLRHQKLINSARVSGDGRRIVTASADGTAQVWDAQTGERVGKALIDPEEGSTGPDPILSADISIDGQRVVTGSARGAARVWDVRTSLPVSGVLRHDKSVLSVRLSAGGDRVVTASADGTARLWDARSGEPIGTELRHGQSVSVAEFNPEGTQVVTGSADHTARIWNALTGAPLGAAFVHAGEVVSAQFSPNGQWVVTASADRTAQVWDVQTGTSIGRRMNGDGTVSSAQFSADGRLVVTASADKARLWDAHAGVPIGESFRHGDGVRILWAELSHDGRRVLTAAQDGTVRIWDAKPAVNRAVEISEPLRHKAWVLSAHFCSPDGQRVLTVPAEDVARLFDLRTRGPFGLPLLHDGAAVTSVAFSPGGEQVATAAGQTVRVWNARTGELIGQPLGQDAPILSLLFRSDGRLLATTVSGDAARIVEAQTGAAVGASIGDGNLRAMSADLDGHRIVTAATNEARIWSADSGEKIGSLVGHRGPVLSVAFSPDGQRVTTASEDGTARVWDARTRTPIVALRGHTGAVQSARFSPDGARVVTASDDNTARVWDAQTGTPIGDRLEHEGQVQFAAFSPDGNRVVTASRDQTARIWDAKTGVPIGEPLRHADGVYDAGFSPDGQRVVTASADGTARIWDALTGLPADAGIVADLAEALGGYTLNETGGLEPIADVTTRRQRLRQQAHDMRRDDPLAAFLPWALADPASRTISPLSSVTGGTESERRLEQTEARPAP